MQVIKASVYENFTSLPERDREYNLDPSSKYMENKKKVQGKGEN